MNNKIKFNIIDFSIILFVVLAILATIFWNDIRNNIKFEEKTAEYSFVARGVTEDELASLSLENKLYFTNDGTYAGTIKSISYEKEVVTVALADGTLGTYEGNTYLIKCTAFTTGKQGENGFYIGNKHFTVAGKCFSLETDTASIDAEITDIKS